MSANAKLATKAFNADRRKYFGGNGVKDHLRRAIERTKEAHATRSKPMLSSLMPCISTPLGAIAKTDAGTESVMTVSRKYKRRPVRRRRSLIRIRPPSGRSDTHQHE